MAHLHIESLSTKNNLRRALENRPEQLDDLYTDAMQRLTSLPTAKPALKVISWIVCATRPLRFIELQHAVATDELEPEDDSILEDCLTGETTIINACVGLIRANEEDYTVGLVHYTTREFFGQKGSEYIPSAKMDAAFACLIWTILTPDAPC
jgi:hypothetical protein